MAKAKLFPAVGDRFAHLTVSGSIFRDGRVRKVECQCDCGEKVIAFVYHLFSSKRTSCGCKKIERAIAQGHLNRRHGGVTGGKRSPTYISWSSMKLRCENPNATGYSRYGGRGIKICPQWSDENGFAQFLADMGERPEGTSLERSKNDGNYEPGNCRWATREDQRRNRETSVLITFQGKTLSAAEWAREIGTHRNNVLRRLKRGLPLDQVLAP